MGLPMQCLRATHRAYEKRLLSNPLPSKFITSLILASTSNVVAQLPRGKVDWACAFKYGLLDAPPHSHFWCAV